MEIGFHFCQGLSCSVCCHQLYSVIRQMLWSAQLEHVGRIKQIKVSGPSHGQRNECGLLSSFQKVRKGGGCVSWRQLKFSFNSAYTKIVWYKWLQNVLACDGWTRSLFSPTMLCALGTSISGTGSSCIFGSSDTWSCCRLKSQDRTARLYHLQCLLAKPIIVNT